MKLAQGKVIIDDTTGDFLDQSDNPALSADGRKLWKSTGGTVLDWETGALHVAVESTDAYISPDAFADHQDDWNPADIDKVRVVRMSTTGGNYELRGLSPLPGRILTLINTAGGDIKIKNESATSTASWRFIYDGDLVIKVDMSATVWYDPISERWRII